MSDSTPNKVHSDELKITVEVPDGWQTTSNEDFQLLVLAPSEADYRANIGFDLTKLESNKLAEITQMLEQSRQEQEANYAEFEQTGLKEINLNGHRGYLRYYNWFYEESNLHFSQIQAFVFVAPNVPIVLGASGSCLQQYAQKYLPILEDIIVSVKFD